MYDVWHQKLEKGNIESLNSVFIFVHSASACVRLSWKTKVTTLIHSNIQEYMSNEQIFQQLIIIFENKRLLRGSDC